MVVRQMAARWTDDPWVCGCTKGERQEMLRCGGCFIRLPRCRGSCHCCQTVVDPPAGAQSRQVHHSALGADEVAHKSMESGMFPHHPNNSTKNINRSKQVLVSQGVSVDSIKGDNSSVNNDINYWMLAEDISEQLYSV